MCSIYSDASVANLRFLTIEQTLADIPYLIEAVRANLNGSANSRVILFGTGLGATLAGWARQKYPHLIDGVWSSSGQFERVVHSSGNAPGNFEDKRICIMSYNQ